ncbi:MAG: Ig-like domain-containing protein, partial [Verrucomicrobiota bacterium]
LSGITSGAANENQSLTVTATSANASLIPNPTVNYASANTTGSLTFTPAPNLTGSALITVTVNDGGASNNIVTQFFTVNVQNFNDHTPPTEQITAPKPNQQWTNGEFTVTGKAGDNVAVGTVYYSLNGSAWAEATTVNNWTNWTANLTLIPGTNTVQAYAVDTSGNISPTNTVKFEYVVLMPLTLSINGKGTVNLNCKGMLLAINENYLMTAKASSGFAFTNWTGSLTTNSAMLRFTMATNLTLTAHFVDVAKPTVSIVTPTSNKQWTNGTFTVTGRAGDNVAAGAVYYSLNGSRWTVATTVNNWTNWTANLTLIPGTNTVQAYAVDTSGNISPTDTVKFKYVVLKPLTVQIVGRGTVNPNYNGALLAINENYTMTARASSGFAFTNWTGSLTTNSAMLRFTMATNLTLTAHFVDVAKPTVSIVTPTSNQQWTNDDFTATGNAGDNVAVAKVYYSLNGSGWAAATTVNNWTNWTANLTLIPGTNTIQAYAVDTSGNTSAIDTVRFAYKTAPSSLAGLMGVVNENGGGTFYLCFGAGTFSQNSANTNYDNGVGNYSYKQLSPNTAQLSITYTAPPNISGAKTVVLLTFITNNECSFSNQSNVVNSGTISLWPVPDWTPASLNGKTSVLIAGGQQATVAFGSGTLTITNASGQATDEKYTFKQYSPLGAMLTVTQPNETNFLQLTFAATNYGSYYATAYDGSSNSPTAGTGVFAMVSESSGGNAPDSLADLAAQVTQSDGSFEMNFGVATFAQNSFATNYANAVGTYVYTKLGADNAALSLNYTAPPAVANAVGPVILTFIAPNFCVLTNQDADGSNTIAAIGFCAPPTNWVPTSLVGRTIYTTNTAGAVDVVTFNGNGTFSQTETGSSKPGASSGSYTFTAYGPLGGMLVLTYSGGVQNGSTSYIQTTFTGQGMGDFFMTFYGAPASPPSTNSGNFTLN